jgi:hypothetical protein
MRTWETHHGISQMPGESSKSVPNGWGTTLIFKVPANRCASYTIGREVDVSFGIRAK